ncbi:uncharacterized protein LOC128034733 [Gossypium raimondii]|uniref:uncharacterized protein LOC128034733 n=1 Tax=Gossypium raimondii TaxID=29730 RepID=UPI00227B29FA|nr:uncharacterized protein LOC128034733 [Gossypium raimondii]
MTPPLKFDAQTCFMFQILFTFSALSSAKNVLRVSSSWFLHQIRKIQIRSKIEEKKKFGISRFLFTNKCRASLRHFERDIQPLHGVNGWMGTLYPFWCVGLDEDGVAVGSRKSTSISVVICI